MASGQPAVAHKAMIQSFNCAAMEWFSEVVAYSRPAATLNAMTLPSKQLCRDLGNYNSAVKECNVAVVTLLHSKNKYVTLTQ